MKFTSTAVAALAIATAASAQIEFSVDANLDNMIGGVTFRDGDIVSYNTGSDTASIVFNEDLFNTSVDITAYHRLANGNILLSVLFNGRTLGGLTFNDGDLVEYNPNTDTATFAGIQESTFDAGGSNPDIYAISVLPDGAYALSTSFDQAINGFGFTDGDLVRYDPNLDVASLLVAEADIFDDGDGDIDAVHALADGTYLISAGADEVVGGVLYADGDVFSYNPANDASSLYFSYDAASPGTADLNALWVPAPGTGVALALAAGVLTRRRRH